MLSDARVASGIIDDGDIDVEDLDGGADAGELALTGLFADEEADQADFNATDESEEDASDDSETL
jgi:hypothetical protein